VNGLDIGDFDAFFREMHGPCVECEGAGRTSQECEHVEPFVWQRELVELIWAERWPDGSAKKRGEWPRTIDLPTASGKTAAIDIAIFTLALDAGMDRHARLRMFFVVDRRVVVDEAYRRAARIASRLAAASSGVASVVAQRLRCLAGTGAEPLATAVLRGGMYREDGWARSPVQPLVAVSTVDQVGSRLLGRGYGVGDGMKPIHQGLVAHDSLIVLDEAHLAEPFCQTLEALEDYAAQAECRLPRPYQVVIMSATPRPTANGPQHFRLKQNHADRLDGRPGRLRQRLEARKLAQLRFVDVGRPPAKTASRGEQRAWAEQRSVRESKFCEETVKAALDLLPHAKCIGVVLNRVGSARRVFERLRNQEDFDAVLLTGRSRPLDREAIIERIWERVRAGRERRSEDRPLLVVATQCIEAGADLDFDGLVTECASLDALKQRFGRLDRLGTLGSSRGSIIARSDVLDDDPIYGKAIGKTWKWLEKKAQRPRGRRGAAGGDAPRTVDFGSAHLPIPTDQEIEGLLAPRREAPVLLPAHLDAWAMTSTRPAVDPDVGLWLHGVNDEAADVQIVWRSDLPETQPELWADIVALCPPGSAEALPVPVYAARAWLARALSPELTDTLTMMEEVSYGSSGGRRALRWRGEDDPRTELVGPGDIAPGDTLVVPSSWGGADEYGWLAEGREPVPDLGDRVQIEQRGRATLRMHPTVWERWVPLESRIYPTLRRLVAQSADGGEEDPDQSVDVDSILVALRDAPDPHPALWLRETARRLHQDSRRRLEAYPDNSGVVLRASRRVPFRVAALWGTPAEAEPDLTTQDDASSFVSRPVRLKCHSLGVQRLARTFAGACGLSADVVDDVALAARLHDIGKADPRFQRWLHGGDEVAAALSELLAKSGMRSRGARERARRIAGYPKGARHELLSLAMVESNIANLRVRDPDLVRHLIASHHGFCRPFAPTFDETDNLDVQVDGDWLGTTFCASTTDAVRASRLDSGVSKRFWSVLRRFGWLGLPYLEAIFRLADHRQSDDEEHEREDAA
jgi:CRISPR-associated endonuclease/helicase Cas3